MLKDLSKEFIRDEEGATLIEYIIIIALVAIFAIVLFPPLRKAVVSWFNSMISNVNNSLSGSGDISEGTTGGNADEIDSDW